MFFPFNYPSIPMAVPLSDDSFLSQIDLSGLTDEQQRQLKEHGEFQSAEEIENFVSHITE